MTVLAATTLPLSNSISESEWRLESAAASFYPTFGFAPTQVVRYASDRWWCKLVFRDLSQTDRHLLAKFLAAVGRHRAFWVIDPSHNLRGSFASSELITSPDAAATWTAGTGRTVIAGDDCVMARYTSTQASYIGTASSISATNGAKYALRAVVDTAGGNVAQAGLKVGTARGDSTYGILAVSATLGRKALKASLTATSCYVTLTDDLTVPSNWSGVYPVLSWRGVSFVRCAEVDGGSGGQTQTGSSLYLKSMPTTVSSILRPGDMVEIISSSFAQVVRVTEALYSDGSGKGIMNFEPQLRAAVSDGDMVVPVKPMIKMMLAEDAFISTRPGWFSDVEINCVEAF